MDVLGYRADLRFGSGFIILSKCSRRDVRVFAKTRTFKFKTLKIKASKNKDS